MRSAQPDTKLHKNFIGGAPINPYFLGVSLSAESIQFGETVTKKRKPESVVAESDDEVRIVGEILYIPHIFNFYVFSTNSYTRSTFWIAHLRMHRS